jgi:hypothetical protein
MNTDLVGRGYRRAFDHFVDANKMVRVSMRTLQVRYPRLIRHLTPALSSFGEERENYFVGRLPRVAPKVFEATAGLISFAPLGQVSLASREFVQFVQFVQFVSRFSARQ